MIELRKIVDAADRPMRQIGKYQVQEQIGIGGFGEVFKGFDPFIKRYVAIKTCSSRSEEIRSRFFQEAEISGNLNHKNITTIHDFGVEGDLPYLVQEYLSGEDLDDKIKRRDALPYAEKLFYLIQIVRGLGHAHRHGVIHRDIKPANVRILEDGTTKIMDFGIAKLAQHESGLTQTGMTLGTAAYLSPEQIRGESVDPRTDIFSFGVLAYELLTYVRPFKGNQISAVLYQLLHHEPDSIQTIWPEAPAELAAVISRCLAKQPVDRYADAATLLQALEGLQWSGAESDSGGTVGAVMPVAAGLASSPPPQPPAAPAPAAASAQPAQPTSSMPRSLDNSMAGAPDEVPTLDDIEISTAMVKAPDLSDEIPVVTTMGHSQQSSSSRWPTLLAILLLAAAAGFGGWWFGARPNSSQGSEEGSSEQVAEETLAASEPVDVQPATPSPADQQVSNGAEEKPQMAQGTVVALKPAWTETMTVQLGNGAARVLDKNRSFKLDPGTYSLTFKYSAGRYNAERKATFELGEAAVKRVASPLAQPAAITVQQGIRKPKGEVFADGLLLGTSPLRQAMLEAGDHLIEIRPRDGGEGLSTQLTLAPGSLVILTFDLEAGSMRQTDKTLELP